jgi:tetratricopeptide (TPR) repeat protein
MKRNRSKPVNQGKPVPHWLWKSSLKVPLILGFVVLAAFGDSVDGELVLDNLTIIGKDTRIQQFNGQNLYLIFSRNYWWPTFESDLYRPLTTFSYLINYSVLGNGRRPDEYHMVNMVLHWLNACLVYLLASRYLVHRVVALVVTLAFAVHPLTIEAVSNIIGRADLFAALFMLAALELHARLRAKSTSQPAWPRFWLGLCALLTVLSKESGVVLIALMLLDDLAHPATAAARGRGAAIKTWLRSLPWKNYACVVPSLVVLTVARYELLKTSPVTHQLVIDNPMALTGFWTHEMTAIKVLGYYFKLTFWPAGLSCDYSYNEIPVFGWTFSGSDIDGWLGLALVVLLSAAALLTWRRRPAVFFFLGFAFIVLLPVSNLVITIGTIMGERFMYLPIVGLLGALASALEWCAGRAPFASALASPRSRRLSAGVVASVIVALGVRTVVRNLDWHDNVRLWRSAIRVCPNSFKTYKGLATSLAADPSQLDECVRLAEQALILVDQDELPLEQSPNGLLCDLARYYTRQGDRLRDSGDARSATAWYEKAEQILERAMRADRAVNAVARRGSLARGMSPDEYHDVGLADIYELQAQVCLRLKRSDEAQKACEWLVRLRCGTGPPYVMWAEICGANAQLDDAAVHLMQATILGEGQPQIWASLERIYAVLQPGAPIVIRQPASAAIQVALNKDNPLVREHLNLAFQGLVEDLLNGHYRAEADSLRRRAIERYQCPPAIFDGLFDKPSKSS